MATIRFKGLDQYIKQLERLSKSSEATIKKSLYQGARVMADAIRENMYDIPADDRRWTPEGQLRNGPRYKEIVELQKSFGITPMRNKNGTIDVKLGFDGYNGLTNDAWPKGKPNGLMARQIESGTSWMKKNPFIRPAEKAYKSYCEEIIKKTLEEEIAKIMK